MSNGAVTVSYYCAIVINIVTDISRQCLTQTIVVILHGSGRVVLDEWNCGALYISLLCTYNGGGDLTFFWKGFSGGTGSDRICFVL